MKNNRAWALFSSALLIWTAAAVAENPERNAYFGDTHIHTMYSFDAFMGSVRTTPDDAYRYGKGEPIDHPAGMSLRISGKPLDFLMVSDHAKYLGVFAAQLDPQAPFYGHPDAQGLRPDTGEGQGHRGLDSLSARLRKLDQEGHDFMGAAPARSDGLTADPNTHRCPDNNAKVNLADCSVSKNTGAVRLMSEWTDPAFNPNQQAFYYVRVLENPSSRWSTWDAVRLGIEPNPDAPAIHQERAWSSPIWYRPS